MAAAIRIIDVEGADALSMRRLGTELGSGATSVYRHVRDKNQLIALAFDAITGEIPLPDPGMAWDEALIGAARGVRDLFHRHEGFVLLIGRRAILGPSTMAILERLVGILRTAGFGDQTSFHAISLTINYASGFTILEILPALRGAGGAGVLEYRQLVSSYLERVPPDTYPHAAIVAPQMVGKGDADFEYGVRAIMAGIRSLGRPDEDR